MATLSPSQVGGRAPDVVLATREGRPVRVHELLAADPRPLLLAFFKASCPTCKLTWPYLERLHRSYGAAVRVVGVSQNDAATAERFYEEFGPSTFDLALDLEPAYRASNAFDVDSVPHLVLLAPDGTVRAVFAGWQRSEMESLARLLASESGLPLVPVVPPGDPVPAMKPG